MLQIRCDNCDRTIEVEQAVAGQKVKCPHCGDVNIIRGVGGEGRSKHDRAAEAGYPPADGPEVDVLRVRPAMLRARPFQFLLLALIALGGLIAAAVLGSTGAGAPLALTVLAVGLAALIWIIAWKLRTLGEGIVITSKRIVDREGFFSKNTSEVRHADIKNVQVRQSFWQRLCGVGTIAVSTAAEHEDEVQMDDVPRPDRVAKVIDLYRPL